MRVTVINSLDNIYIYIYMYMCLRYSTDVVYDTSIVPALVKVLSAFLHSDLQRRAYVASTVRNMHTRDQFIQALGNIR